MVKAFALLLVLSGCNYVTSSFVTNDFSGDEFPVSVETSSGGIVLGVQPTGGPIETAVLDVMSPVTVIDPGTTANPTISFPGLNVMGVDPLTGLLDKPRARFPDAQVVRVHPCTDDSCAIGSETTPRPIDAILGMDSFVSDALRLDVGASQLFILPDVAGDNSNRGLACDAALAAPFRGGGTLIVGGTEVGFANFRVAIDTCLAFNPDPTITQEKRGANVQLVMSTALGMSILDETAYGRYRAIVTSAPDISALADGSVRLPSGLVRGKLTQISSLALVGNSSGTSARAPCRQMYAHHLLSVNDCTEGEDCPCTGATFCPVPAVIELTPATPIDVLVVPDDDPTLQALRAELRPDRPEVDGILGTQALAALELDLDYPHNRALGRCTDITQCVARPELSAQTRRESIANCLALPPGPISRSAN
ncbi:MAG: hypothetical protein JO257_11505 [Deltaproteobacteria bacterium]|nr:hypothetical protein [Deltaproteobacteria bacterium]